MNTTETLATYFVKTTYDDIPRQVVQLAKRYFKDWLAAAIGGYGDKAGKIMVDYATYSGGMPEARIIGKGLKTSLANATLVNGALGHLLDFDDSGPSHPTACTLPTALAFGEMLNASGKEILLAQIMGYECFNRLYQASREYELVLRRRGIHPTSLWGPCAAAMVAAKLLKLDVAETRMALGVAASQASGLMENFGTPTKGLHCGFASRAGATAAILIHMGYKASQTILEGSHGFYNAFIGQDNYHLDRITNNLGKDWLLLSPGIDTKMYPACAATLRAIEASVNLANAHDIKPDHIESIEVLINSTRRNFLRFDRPSSGDEAKFSMPYAVAIGLTDRNITLESFTDEKVNQLSIQKIMDKVKLTVMDDSLSDEIKKTTPVTITLANGNVYTENVVDFTGTAKNPMSDDDFREKFLYCSSIPEPGMPREQVDDCIEIINDLENQDRIDTLMDTLMIEKS